MLKMGPHIYEGVVTAYDIVSRNHSNRYLIFATRLWISVQFKWGVHLARLPIMHRFSLSHLNPMTSKSWYRSKVFGICCVWILIKWSKWWVGFGIAMWALSNKLFFPHFYTWYFKLDESSKFRMLSWDSCCVVHCLHEETEDLMSFAHFVAFQQDATHENSSNHFNTTTIPKVKCSLLETSIVATSSPSIIILEGAEA